MRLDEQFLMMALPDIEIIRPGFPVHPHFSIDTRSLQSGDVFVALPGDHVDGHTYIPHAIEKGASGIIVDQQHREQLALYTSVKHLAIAVVPDTKQAIIRLAQIWRLQFDIPVVGITGSVGKTTTKEMLSRIAQTAGIEHVASYGNNNTRLGVALTMLRLRPEHKLAIVEMGISQRGEMGELARIVKPTTAIITMVGHAHMEGLGSLQDIAIEKRDIFKHFTESSIGIINGDVPLLAHVGYRHPVVKFGMKTVNQVQARKITMSGTHTNAIFKFYDKKYPVRLAKAHEGMVYCALAAMSAGYLLDIPVPVMIEAIQTPIDVPGRFQECRMTNHQGVVINDCYNANPESMKAALAAFESYETSGQKIAVIGDMLELGVNSPFWHRQVGRFLRKTPSIQRVILVGNMVNWTNKTVPVSIAVDLVPDWQAALKLLEGYMTGESAILVKGSNGMKLGNLVTALTQPAPVPSIQTQTAQAHQ